MTSTFLKITVLFRPPPGWISWSKCSTSATQKMKLDSHVPGLEDSSRSKGDGLFSSSAFNRSNCCCCLDMCVLDWSSKITRVALDISSWMGWRTIWNPYTCLPESKSWFWCGLRISRLPILFLNPQSLPGSLSWSSNFISLKVMYFVSTGCESCNLFQVFLRPTQPFVVQHRCSSVIHRTTNVLFTWPFELAKYDCNPFFWRLPIVKPVSSTHETRTIWSIHSICTWRANFSISLSLSCVTIHIPKRSAVTTCASFPYVHTYKGRGPAHWTSNLQLVTRSVIQSPSRSPPFHTKYKEIHLQVPAEILAYILSLQTQIEMVQPPQVPAVHFNKPSAM